jgi:hypothetical protein
MTANLMVFNYGKRLADLFIRVKVLLQDFPGISALAVKRKG